jgi:hypothetical protein
MQDETGLQIDNVDAALAMQAKNDTSASAAGGQIHPPPLAGLRPRR